MLIFHSLAFFYYSTFIGKHDQLSPISPINSYFCMYTIWPSALFSLSFIMHPFFIWQIIPSLNLVHIHDPLLPRIVCFQRSLKIYSPCLPFFFFSLLSQALGMSTDMGMNRICLRTMFYNTKFTLLDRPNDPDPNSSLGSETFIELDSILSPILRTIPGFLSGLSLYRTNSGLL